MLHGLSFLPDCTPQTKSASDYYADAFRLSIFADEHGLSSVKMTEHYLGAYGGYCPSPLSFLSNVAARTSQIRLMTGCVLPAFHHPIQLAAETALVDVMSGGRLDVGVARAWLPYEFDAFGVELDDSRELFTVALDTLIKLWTQDSVTVDSRFFSFTDATSTPKPVQQPHPPLWGAAVLSPESFVNLGKAGHNLLLPSSFSGLGATKDFIKLYREAYASTHPGEYGLVALSAPLVIRPSMQDAVDVADHYLARYLDVWATAGDSWNLVRSSNYRNYTGMSYALRATTPQRLREAGSAVVGDPAAVAEQLRMFEDDLGVDLALWQIDFGAMPGELAETTLHSLVEHVLPAAGKVA